MKNLFDDETPVFAKAPQPKASSAPATVISADDDMPPPRPLNGTVNINPPSLTPDVATTTLAVKSSKTQVATIDLDKIDAAIDSTDDKATQGVATISQKMLSSLRASDADVFGQKLNALVMVSKGLDPKNMKSGMLSKITHIFGTTKEKFMAQYNTVEKQMDSLVNELDKSSNLHRQRIVDFNTMYSENYSYHQALEVQRQKKISLKEQLEQQLAGMGKPTDAFTAQNMNLLQDRVNRLEKRVNDIERAKLLSKQMAPEIMQLENNARSLVETFKDVKETTIPAWRNAFTLYIAQIEQKKGAELANAVYDATDEAFRVQAEQFNQNTQEIAKVRQRSVVSIETLEYVQTQLMDAFDKLGQIEADGKKARAESEPRMAALEKQLVDKFTPGAKVGV